MQTIRDWLQRHLNDPQVVALTIVLLVGLGIVVFFGDMLAPVFTALVVAYLLEGVVQKLERWTGRGTAVGVVFALFIAGFGLVLFALVPTLTHQIAQLVENLPRMLDRGQEALLRLPERYPDFFSTEQARAILASIRQESVDFGRRVVASISLSQVVKLFTLIVYAILVPLLVFFFLKDKDRLLDWLNRCLPRHRHLARTVWHEVDVQIGNYVRGKFVEILIVGIAAYVIFILLGLQFAALLAVITGLSVIIPYIGATVITVPIAIVAYFQFGPSMEFVWVMVAYALIQAVDGNVLVPLLFSEVVNLHPVAIIVAILVFGGIWGFWGIFFAIPLATLINAVINAWPRSLPDHRDEAGTAHDPTAVQRR
ncbi:AI-2E family transporter [Arhodomonas sp. SL1]|uniref:AI-2E family transporter n=1 Tax=Arhodomonas sp. SL1 TaxID=3425691 RepID=UPI003F884B23